VTIFSQVILKRSENIEFFAKNRFSDFCEKHNRYFDKKY